MNERLGTVWAHTTCTYTKKKSHAQGRSENLSLNLVHATFVQRSIGVQKMSKKSIEPRERERKGTARGTYRPFGIQ